MHPQAEENLQQQQQQQQQQRRRRHNNLYKIRLVPAFFEIASKEREAARARADAILENKQYIQTHGLLGTQPQNRAMTQFIQAWDLCRLEHAPKRLVELAG
jgi:hypothetical protein